MRNLPTWQPVAGGLAAGLLSVALIGSPAEAADIYKPAPPPPAYSAPLKDYGPITWSGFYLGGNLGANFGNDDNFTGDDTRFIGGVHGGYNFQRGNWLFGIEGDANFAEDIDYLASVRGRLGFVADKWLIYGTGGVAFAGFDDVKVGGIKFKSDDDNVGFVVGGGVEKKVAQNFSVGLEGLYYDFDDVKFKNDEFEVKSDESFWTVRARVTYHFGDRGEAPLK